MTKKKTPPPVKKAAPKKKENKPTWKQTGEANIHGIGAIKNFTVKFDEDTKPSAQDILDAVTAENYALKALLSKHQSEPMPQTQGSKVQQQPVTMLEQFHFAMDSQLERQQASLFRLAGIADKLQVTKEEGYPVPDISCPDISTRLSNAIGSFARQNEQFEILVEKLSKLI